MSEYIIEMKNITKRFPGIVANDDVTIQIKKGEIYASFIEYFCKVFYFITIFNNGFDYFLFLFI